jgi:hypothetical protein
MDKISLLSDKFFFTIELIYNSFQSINPLIVKSDEENLNNLLKNPKDKVTFEKTVDELLKNNGGSKEILINGKMITISI